MFVPDTESAPSAAFKKYKLKPLEDTAEGDSSSFLYMKPCQTLCPSPGAEELVAFPGYSGAKAARV